MKTKLLSSLLVFCALLSGPVQALSTSGVLAAVLASSIASKASHSRHDTGPGTYASDPIGSGANDFSACKQHFPQNRPIDFKQPETREVCFDEFAVLHSAATKSPVLVFERLNAAKITSARKVKRKDRFYEEARLPSASRARLSDYAGSNYQRGHMAPAGDMPSVQAMAQSFSLANIIPQNPANNTGVWEDIEKATRKFALRAKGNVYVFTGPRYEGAVAHIGSSRVPVPSHLFKVVYDEAGQRAWAYWLPNTSDARIQRITYKQYRELGGIDVLTGIALHD